jgi:uncharacterized radical SAM superfamily protein
MTEEQKTEDRPVESELIEKKVETTEEAPKKKEFNRMCLICGGQKTEKSIPLWPFLDKYCECMK